MHLYKYEAMDATGQEIKDIIYAENEQDAQDSIRRLGYFVTKIYVAPDQETTIKPKKKRLVLKTILFITVPIWFPLILLWCICGPLISYIYDTVKLYWTFVSNIVDGVDK